MNRKKIIILSTIVVILVLIVGYPSILKTLKNKNILDNSNNQIDLNIKQLDKNNINKIL